MAHLLAGRCLLSARHLSIACFTLAVSITPMARAADPASPTAAGPHREGFTLELGLGAGLTRTSSDVVTGCVGIVCSNANYSESTVSATHLGLAPLSLGLGGFVSPQVAILFRASGTSFFEGDHQWVNSLYGVAVQYWPADIVFVGGGAGVATFGENVLLVNHNSETKAGFGFSARAGIAVATLTHHSLRFSLELLPTFYETVRIFGSALCFEWQYF